MQVIDYNPHLGYKDEVVRSYMGLARKTAGRFKWAVYRSPNISLQDLVSEATIGLIKAFHNFDPDKFGGRVRKFTTYAVPMIEGEIRQFIYKHGQILKVSSSMYALGGAILRNGLLQAPILEIVEKTGCSELEATRALKYLHETKAVSLDQPIKGDDGAAELQDFIGMENDLSGLEVAEFVATLDSAERSFVEMRMRGEAHRAEADSLLLRIREKLMAYTGLREREVMEMNTELTKEKYLELKKQSLSDERICSDFHLGPSALYRRKKNWGLTGTGQGKSPVKSKSILPREELSSEMQISDLTLKNLELRQQLERATSTCAELEKRIDQAEQKGRTEQVERLERIEKENAILKSLLKQYL